MYTERSEVYKKPRGHEGRGDPDVGVRFMQIPVTFWPVGAKPCASAPKRRRQKIGKRFGNRLRKKNFPDFFVSWEKSAKFKKKNLLRFYGNGRGGAVGTP